MNKFVFFLIITFLVVSGAGLIFYKNVNFQYPLLPENQEEVWTIETKIKVEAEDKDIRVEFYVPSHLKLFTILDEDYVSQDYNLSTTREGLFRKAVWSSNATKGLQILYYRVNLHQQDLNQDPAINGSDEPHVIQFVYEDPFVEQTINELTATLAGQTSGPETFTLELLEQFRQESPQEDIRFLLRSGHTIEERTQLAVKILSANSIPARKVYAVPLDPATEISPVIYLAVYNGKEWVIFDPRNGNMGLPKNTFIWHSGAEPLLQTSGEKDNIKVTFSVTSNKIKSIFLAEQYSQIDNSMFFEFSVHQLPVSIQNAFKVILLVPIGALIIVLFRNVIGIQIAGTFMPILIALSFRETSLVAGLIMFVTIITIGLFLRSYLSKMDLLLVPRVSAVVVIVIMLMLMLSVVSYRIGFYEGLTVTFFPLIILSWTIERMSIIWEEEGGRAACLQLMGSLFTAVIAFLCMSNAVIKHIVFLFPESLLIVLAGIILLGRYRGYRLTELFRFRNMS